MKGIGLIFVACCLVQSGCVSPYNFYSEAELLQMVSDYEAGRSLSANPNVLGSPVGDSAFLVGKWKSEFETQVILCGLFETSGVCVPKMSRLVSLVEWDFRPDGTYSRSVGMVYYFQGGNSSPRVDRKVEGSWRLKNGELLLVESLLTDTTASLGVNLGYRDVVNKMRVSACSEQEIMIDFASSLDMKSADEDIKTQQATAIIARYGKANQMYTNSRIAYGWDSRGYAVKRMFTVMNGDNGGFLSIEAVEPAVCKRIASYSLKTEQTTKRDASPTSKAPMFLKYSLESLIWNDRKDFECQFVVRLTGEPCFGAYFDVQREFVAQMRDVYLKMHPGTNPASLNVDVRPKLEDGRIVGSAVVLTITPVSLNYNANTRRGKLAVRYCAGQYEEARRWIIRNIETLARDKNIALVTGQLPPAATYYSLGETTKDGNILEIEFKTE